MKLNMITPLVGLLCTHGNPWFLLILMLVVPPVRIPNMAATITCPGARRGRVHLPIPMELEQATRPYQDPVVRPRGALLEEVACLA